MRGVDLLLVYRFVCSVESQSRERSVSPAARTERGPDRPGPLATDLGGASSSGPEPAEARPRDRTGGHAPAHAR